MDPERAAVPFICPSHSISANTLATPEAANRPATVGTNAPSASPSRPGPSRGARCRILRTGDFHTPVMRPFLGVRCP
ncbi:hypothetical protein GCM10018777_58650 [Streptomyces albogriseolus]|nr:hypothetical protein GCM10018777_58650 [Streptomyces viridodiastaticus]